MGVVQMAVRDWQPNNTACHVSILFLINARRRKRSRDKNQRLVMISNIYDGNYSVSNGLGKLKRIASRNIKGLS